MSNRAINWAWLQKVTPTQKLVLLHMADKAGDSLLAWSSVRKMAIETGLTERSIYRAIDDLRVLGLITRVPSLPKVKSKTYLLHVVDNVTIGRPMPLPMSRVP